MKQQCDRVAGLDVHRDTVVPCVRLGRGDEPEIHRASASSTGRCNGPAMMAGSPRADDRWRAQHARQRTQRAGT
jgi:hypothetical protein